MLYWRSMKLKVKSKKPTVPAPSTPHDPDIEPPKPEQELALLKALKQGPKSLGDLRRDHELSAIVLGQILKLRPKVFRGYEDAVGRYLVGLTSYKTEPEDNRVQPESIDQKIAKLVEDAKWNGISTNRLWGRHRIPTKVSEDFQARHADLVDLVEREDNQRRLKKFLVWKTAKRPTEPVPVPIGQSQAFANAVGTIESESEQNAPEPVHRPSVELALDRDQLCHLIAAGARGSQWLEARYGITMARIQAVCREYPELRIRVEKRYDSPLSEFSVSIAPEEPPIAPEPALKAAQTPVEMPKLTPEDLQRMRWKPGAHRVAKPEHPEHRTRHPLPI